MFAKVAKSGIETEEHRSRQEQPQPHRSQPGDREPRRVDVVGQHTTTKPVAGVLQGDERMGAEHHGNGQGHEQPSADQPARTEFRIRDSGYLPDGPSEPQAELRNHHAGSVGVVVNHSRVTCCV